MATISQQKFFFSLCEKLGADAEEAKEQAKKKFNAKHFKDLTNTQVSELITILNKEIAKENSEKAETQTENKKGEIYDLLDRLAELIKEL